MDGADATVLGALATGTGLEAGTGDVLGDVCAVDSPRPGVSRCTFKSNFITVKPITNTTLPKISGIGEMRSRPPVTGRRGPTGALAGLAHTFARRQD